MRKRRKGTSESSPLRETIKYYKKEVFFGFGFTAFWSVAYYGLLTYMPSYMTGILGVPSNLAFIATTASILVLISLIPIFGKLSDKIGRKPLLLTSTISALLLTFPLFKMISTGSFIIILLALVIFAVIISLFAGPGVAAITEIFPTHIRYTALSIGYNFANAVFGGTAPFIATFLVSKTGSNTAPAFYIIMSALFTTIILTRITFKPVSKQQVESIRNVSN